MKFYAHSEHLHKRPYNGKLTQQTSGVAEYEFDINSVHCLIFNLQVHFEHTGK